MYKLMIKKHNKTGLKYLCVTSKDDHELYRGSGYYWKRHLRTHGNDVSTQILFETSSLEELKNEGIKYSAIYDVVESDEWANLIPETGYNKDKQRSGWFGWYNNLTEEEVKKRNKNISEKVKERFKSMGFAKISSILSDRRLNLSDKKKQIRKEKIQKTYASGIHNKLFERYSEERMGANNPAAVSITVENITYGSVQDASRKTGIPAHKLYRMRKKHEN